MTKAAIFFFGLVAVFVMPAKLRAQDSANAIAVNEAVLRQANTIVLKQKLAEARKIEEGGDLAGAAKLYQESCELVQKIGSGIDVEAARAVKGLSDNRLALARAEQSRGDLRAAATQANQVLKVDPKNPAALAFKKQIDDQLAAQKGRIPSSAMMSRIPEVVKEKVEASTLVQDGKLLYEMGKLEDAEAKLNQALALDTDNAAAYYYLNLIQQAKFLRETSQHTVDTQRRMAQVEKQWVLPTSKVNLPTPNPYATNNLVYTGPGRQAIISKLDRIHLDVSCDGLPLSEVLRNLAEQSKLRDPERKGISFLINPNPDLSGQAVAAPAGGAGIPGTPAAGGIDPATGLPMAAPGAAPAAGAGGGETLDVGAYIVKIPSLADVRMADVLDAIVMVCDHPVKYSIQDFAVVFSQKGAESPQLFSRVFKVDPNTFYSGLENVGVNSFGGNSQNVGGIGNNQNSSAVVGVVNAFAGAGGMRGNGNFQGGGFGGTQGGSGSLLSAGSAGGATNTASSGSEGGLSYVTTQTSAATPSELAIKFFTSLGVNLQSPPGKAVFFNDRLGKLFVKATEQDLETIERAIEMLNEVAPQVHIKSRFVEVEQDDNKALGFDWYLGQFKMGGHQVVGQGGNGSSSAGSGILPTVPGSDNFAVGQLFNSGLSHLTDQSTPNGYTAATFSGILSNPNFQVVLRALESRAGVESLAEPEVTTTSGRQTQMRATKVLTVITGIGTSTSSGTTSSGSAVNSVNNIPQTTYSFNTTPLETGPILDVVPYVLSDGYTINLALIPSVTDFLGYSKATDVSVISAGGNGNFTYSPIVLPNFSVRQVVTTVNVWDNQTVVLGGLISSSNTSEKDKIPVIGDLPLLGRLFQSQSKSAKKNNLMIFVTATIVDPAGNRVHSDDDLPFAQNAIPAQLPGAGQVKETVKEVHSLPAANL